MYHSCCCCSCCCCSSCCPPCCPPSSPRTLAQRHRVIRPHLTTRIDASFRWSLGVVPGIYRRRTGSATAFHRRQRSPFGFRFCIRRNQHRIRCRSRSGRISSTGRSGVGARTRPDCGHCSRLDDTLLAPPHNDNSSIIPPARRRRKLGSNHAIRRREQFGLCPCLCRVTDGSDNSRDEAMGVCLSGHAAEGPMF